MSMLVVEIIIDLACLVVAYGVGNWAGRQKGLRVVTQAWCCFAQWCRAPYNDELARCMNGLWHTLGEFDPKEYERLWTLYAGPPEVAWESPPVTWN